jgi:hypothetical protein
MEFADVNGNYPGDDTYWNPVTTTGPGAETYFDSEYFHHGGMARTRMSKRRNLKKRAHSKRRVHRKAHRKSHRRH